MLFAEYMSFIILLQYNLHHALIAVQQLFLNRLCIQSCEMKGNDIFALGFCIATGSGAHKMSGNGESIPAGRKQTPRTPCLPQSRKQHQL